MHSLLTTAVAAISFFGAALAQNATSTSSGSIPEYTLQAENITAKFIPYGARLTSLVVNDRNGSEQDIVVGYDDPAQYVVDTETNRTFFGKTIRQSISQPH
jgi:aldose 1-epimerase